MKKAPTFEELSLFKKIYEEQSLSKASSFLGMPPSSASHMLSHLRDIFGDPLFVKTGNGVVPTPKADELFPGIVELIRSMERLVRPEGLDLKKVRDVIRIACADNAPFMLFPHLLENLIKQAPNLTLSIKPLTSKRMDDLRMRDLDFVISPMENDLSEGYYWLNLAVNHYSLVSSTDHPLVKLEKEYPEGLPDKEIGKYGFIDVFLDRSLLGASTLRQWVAPQWSAFRRCLVTTYFLPSAQMLECSNLLTVMPTQSAKLLGKRYKLTTLKTKTKLLTNNPRLIWHEVTNSDPLHQWIRGMITSSIEKGNERPTACKIKKG